RAISDTAATVWSEPLPLRKAAQTLPAKSTTALKVQQTTPLPASTLYTLDYVAQSASGLTNMFAKEDQQSETGGLQSASQLAASSSWQRPSDAVEYSDALN